MSVTAQTRNSIPRYSTRTDNVVGHVVPARYISDGQTFTYVLRTYTVYQVLQRDVAGNIIVECVEHISDVNDCARPRIVHIPLHNDVIIHDHRKGE